MSKKAMQERDEAIAQLKKFLKPGDTIYTVLRHVSKSGMSRDIDLYLMLADGPLYLSGYAATALGERRAPDQGIRVGGCGMDMGFHLVYNLSRTLWPEGFTCIGRSGQVWGSWCPANDHSHDRYHEEVTEAMRYAPDRFHKDGGYALRHHWI